MKVWPLVLFAIIYLIGVLFISDDEYNDQIKQQELYCEMVQIYKDSNGQNGWPPYKGEC